MSVLDDIKKVWRESYTEEPDAEMRLLTLFAAFLVSLAIGLILLGVLAILWVVARLAVPVVVIVGLLYLAGAYFLGWPIPVKLKKVASKFKK